MYFVGIFCIHFRVGVAKLSSFSKCFNKLSIKMYLYSLGMTKHKLYGFVAVPTLTTPQKGLVDCGSQHLHLQQIQDSSKINFSTNIPIYCFITILIF